MGAQRGNKTVLSKDIAGVRQRTVMDTDASVCPFEDGRPAALQMKRLQEVAGQSADSRRISQLRKVMHERGILQRMEKPAGGNNPVTQLTPSDRLKELDTLTHGILTGKDFLELNPLLAIQLEEILREVSVMREPDTDGADMREFLELRIEIAIGKLKAKASANRAAWQDNIEQVTKRRPEAVDKPPGAYHAAPGRWAETIATVGIKPGSSGEKGLDQLYSCFAPTAEGMAVLGSAKPVAFRIKSAYLHNFSFIRWGAGGEPTNKEIRCLGTVPAKCLECTPFLGHKNGNWVDAQTQLQREKDKDYKGERFLIVSEAVKEKYDREERIKKAKVEAAKKDNGTTGKAEKAVPVEKAIGTTGKKEKVVPVKKPVGAAGKKEKEDSAKKEK